MVKGYHECPLSQPVSVKKKRGDPALKVTDDGRGQLGQMQRELVPVLACFPVSILNLLNNKDFS